MSTTALKKAKSAYALADTKTKKTLEEVFGKNHFVEKQKANDEKFPKSFKEAWLGFKKRKFKDKLYIALQKRNESELTISDKLLIIACEIRGGWKPDYDNLDQKKWYSWMYKTASGWVFSDTFYGITHSYTAVGPRFVFQSEKAARYFVEQFIDEQNEFMTIE